MHTHAHAHVRTHTHTNTYTKQFLSCALTHLYFLELVTFLFKLQISVGSTQITHDFRVEIEVHVSCKDLELFMLTQCIGESLAKNVDITVQFSGQNKGG